MILKSASHEISNLRVFPLAAVVVHKIRTIADLSFDEQRREKRGGLDRDIDPDIVAQSPCVLALSTFLAEFVSLRKQFPVMRILMSKRATFLALFTMSG